MGRGGSSCLRMKPRWKTGTTAKTATTSTGGKEEERVIGGWFSARGIRERRRGLRESWSLRRLGDGGGKGSSSQATRNTKQRANDRKRSRSLGRLSGRGWKGGRAEEGRGRVRERRDPLPSIQTAHELLPRIICKYIYFDFVHTAVLFGGRGRAPASTLSLAILLARSPSGRSLESVPIATLVRDYKRARHMFPEVNQKNDCPPRASVGLSRARHSARRRASTYGRERMWEHF